MCHWSAYATSDAGQMRDKWRVYTELDAGHWVSVHCRSVYHRVMRGQLVSMSSLRDALASIRYQCCWADDAGQCWSTHACV